MHEHTKRTDNNTNSKHERELPFGIPPHHRGLRGKKKKKKKKLTQSQGNYITTLVLLKAPYSKLANNYINNYTEYHGCGTQKDVIYFISFILYFMLFMLSNH